ncbi:MAG TPA: glycosyltransferase family 4 protein [Gemmatimonas sp.]|nr:glycosyltransferase family 4 protein [Gemmatimonas sp.]
MRHLIVSREFPPAPYPPGGIGTYVSNLARLLVEAGETVHIIAQRWNGAPTHRESSHDGRLIVHRVGIDRLAGVSGGDAPWLVQRDVIGVDRETVDALAASAVPSQAFAYRASLLAEWLVEHEGIDIVEGQEWEAPLAFFQQRRALGLGPSQHPPCIVHLHSPTEFIYRHNEWTTDRPDYVPSVCLEDYSIAAADALLCPSRFLAGQAAEHYAIAPESIDVIPLPRGDTPIARRDAATWRDGTICFVGRLEPRKGVLEWVDAALSVLDDYPDAHFEFIGSDLPLLPGVSVQQALEDRIPPRHRRNFSFLGSKSRPELMARLARARIGVVPSRWENFPNTCLEMMASGLPVLVSPEGGMREMVSDGESGWIASRADAAGLALALRRALTASPETLRSMGVAAAGRVRDLCDNHAIVARHLEVRRRVAERGSSRSCSMPESFPWSRADARGRPSAPRRQIALPVSTRLAEVFGSGSGDTSDEFEAAGVAIIVIAEHGVSPLPCMRSVDALQDDVTRRFLVGRDAWDLPDGWEAITDLESALELVALERDRANGATNRSCHSIALVEAEYELHTDFLRGPLAALRADSRLGVVAPWTFSPDGSCAGGIAPVLPYQLLQDLAGGALVFRARALHAVDGFPSAIPPRYWCWDATTAVMAAGWGAVAWPQPLARRHPAGERDSRIEAHVGRLHARRAMLERATPAVAARAVELVLELEARQPSYPQDVSLVPRSVRNYRPGTWTPTWTSSYSPPVDAHTALAMLDAPARLRWAASVVNRSVRRGAREPVRAARWFFPRLWRASRESVRRMLHRGASGEVA